VPVKPAAEVTIDEALVRELLVAQAKDVVADVESLPLTKVAEGWDSEVWRLGPSHAVRLPRRALAAPLVAHEHQSLPVIGPRIERSGVRVPIPVVRGAAGAGYPWSWSVVPWFGGRRGIDVARAQRAGWTIRLADALRELHVEAPEDHPVNPVRGRPLSTRADVVAARLTALLDAGTVNRADAATLASAWAAGLAVDPWSRAPVWVHGDLHPGNLVDDDGALAAIIDFGDVTAGDPAYDLAVAWLAFDEPARSHFIASTAERYDGATWTRARAWAAAVAVLLLTHSDDEPAFAALGRETVAELRR
jgi:aminoglycoside phosphotransferase (APT) family kinase protein